MLDLWKDDNIFWEALIASVVLHFLIFHAGDLGMKFPERHGVEIDITHMRSVGAPAAPKTAAPQPPKPVEKPKEWTKSSDQKADIAPIPTAPVPQAPEPPPPPTEIGIGLGDGSEAQLTMLPQLLNLSDLAAIQKRFYPEKAREDGREAVVVLDIHIGADGKVSSVNIVQSADPDFESAAVHVAQLLRFKPAYVSGQAVAVKMRQAIQFKLER